MNLSFLGIFGIFDPISDAIGDVEFTDIVFSQLRDDPKADDNIVLVNIGTLTRGQIAAQIEIINKYQPKAIGMDCFFFDQKPDTLGDMYLSSVLENVDNLVMASRLSSYNSDTKEFDSLEESHPIFSQKSIPGLANLFTDADEQRSYKVCRTFPPYKIINGDSIYALSVELARFLNPIAAQKFIDRNRKEEVINYRGNLIDFGRSNFGIKFSALDVSDVFTENFVPEMIKDKIILFGYLGESFQDESWEDKFYTPLNVQYAGKANPDMFGAVIHANIISMILNEDYINQMSKVWSIIWAILICFVNVFGFTIIYRKLPQWYDGLTKTIQLVEILLLLLLTVLVFHWFSYKFELTLATVTIALAGDSLEVYFGLVKNSFSKKKRKRIFRTYNEHE